MDCTEAISIVMRRLQPIEAGWVSTKIVGYILLQNNGDQEILNLASAPNNVFYRVIHQFKTQLEQLNNNWTVNPNPLFSLNPSQSLIPLSPALVPFQNQPTYSNPRIVPNNMPIQVFDPYFELKLLGLRIFGLLMARRGSSVSLDSLPDIYFKVFGKTLAAEGITDSNDLRRFIERVKHIKVIKRLDGQEDLILEEEFPALGVFKESDVPKNYPDRFEPSKTPPIYSDMESKFQSMSLSRGYDNSGSLKNKLNVEQEQDPEFETWLLALTKLQQTLNQNRTNSRLGLTITNNPDKESDQELNLPDRPFGDSQV